MFVHTVFFYVKPDAALAARDQLIEDCRGYLGKIPTVRELLVGVPAMTPREVVDNSYGVGLTVVLEDAAAHDLYQTHPLHLDFIRRNKETWASVKIYDYLT